MEAILKARGMGFGNIIVLTNRRNLGMVCNERKKSQWQGKSIVADFNFLKKQGKNFQMAKAFLLYEIGATPFANGGSMSPNPILFWTHCLN